MSVSRGGHRARRGDASDPPSNAYELLGGTSRASPPIDSDLPRGWLADLEGSRLVITPDYVGPPRRRDDRGPSADEPVSGEVLVVAPVPHRDPGEGGEGDEAVRRAPVLRARHLVMAVVSTLAVAVPLTLVATHVL